MIIESGQRRRKGINAALVAAGLAAWAPTAQGQGGALPKGDTSIDAANVSGPEKTVERKTCLADLVRAPGANGAFTSDGGTLYLLANLGPTTKTKKKGGDSFKNKITLYKIGIESRMAEPLLSLDQKGDAMLVTYGEPLEGVSAVVLVGKSTACSDGPAGIVTVSMLKKDTKPVQQTGTFSLAATPGGTTLFDVKKAMILEMDTQTFQTRISRKVTAGERPLYFDAKARRVVTFHDDGKNRGLIDYESEGDKKGRKLAFKKTDRVLQQGRFFAALTNDDAKNAVKLTELPEWTGLDKPGEYRMVLPPLAPSKTAAFEVNFAKRRAIAIGNTFTAKQQWQKAYIFDYTREDPIASLATTGKQYVNFAAIAPRGDFAVFEVRAMEDRKTAVLKVFDFATKKFSEIKLPPPAAGGGS